MIFLSWNEAEIYPSVFYMHIIDIFVNDSFVHVYFFNLIISKLNFISHSSGENSLWWHLSNYFVIINPIPFFIPFKLAFGSAFIQ